MKWIIAALLLSLIPTLNCYGNECVSGDCRNGYGVKTITGASGGEYSGQYKNGKMNGQGTLTFNNGKKYVGEFKNGKINGQGSFTWKGATYAGSWVNYKKNGSGILTTVDDKQYAEVWDMGKLVWSTEITHQQQPEVPSNPHPVVLPSGHRWKKPTK